MKIILISGLAGSGKTTTAQLLKVLLESKGYYCVLDSFAKELKTFYAEENSISVHELYNRTQKKNHRTGLQTVGQEIKERLKDDSHWANILFQKYEQVKHLIDFLIIDDLRLPVEIHRAEKTAETIVVKLLNKGKGELTETQKQHITEIAFKYISYDTPIMNDFNLNHLLYTLQTIIEAW